MNNCPPRPHERDQVFAAVLIDQFYGPRGRIASGIRSNRVAIAWHAARWLDGGDLCQRLINEDAKLREKNKQ